MPPTATAADAMTTANATATFIAELRVGSPFERRSCARTAPSSLASGDRLATRAGQLRIDDRLYFGGRRDARQSRTRGSPGSDDAGIRPARDDLGALERSAGRARPAHRVAAVSGHIGGIGTWPRPPS